MSTRCVIFGHHSRRLFKGEWPGYPLAPGAGIRHLRHTHDSFEFPEVSEEIEMRKGSRGFRNAEFGIRNEEFRCWI